MDPSYQDDEVAKKYLEFLSSPDGKIQREILWQYLRAYLPAAPDAAILDAGCGNGWLAQQLSGRYGHIAGCDLSSALIEDAKINFPPGDFRVSDICLQQPFPDREFDLAILNMVVHDLADQAAALRHIFAMLKPGGALLLTLINPYYAYPAGQWKRSLKDFLLLRKPKLVLNAYNFLAKKNRQFIWKQNIPGLFYTLPETLNTCLSAGFRLNALEEIRSNKDSRNFDLNYRLYRFPIILLLHLEKPAQ